MANAMNLLLKHNKLAIAVFLLISALFSIFVWTATKHYFDTLNQQRFESRTSDSVKKIQSHLLRCGDILTSGVSFINASDNVTQQDWHDFVQGLNIQQNYPGMQGFGFSVMLSPDEVSPMEQKMRANGSRAFTLKPTGDREQYSTIMYLEPMDERNVQAIGYDMYSNPIRKLAMDTARDSGTYTLSGKVTLVQEIDADKQAGFLLYAPLYQKSINMKSLLERQKGLIGFVYTPFRMNDLMRTTGIEADYIDFQIYDGNKLSDETLMYDSSKNASYPSQYTLTKSLSIYNHQWTIAFSSSPQFDASNKHQYPLLMTAASLAAYFILISIIFTLLKSKYLLQRQTDELNAIQKTLYKKTHDLLEAKEAAEASNRTKSTFLAAMSHEIRTPMNGVLGMLGLLNQSKLNVAQQNHLHIAISNATSLLVIINDILDFSKIEAGKMDLELLEFNINNTLEDFVESQHYKAEEKGLELILDTTNITYPNIITDPGRLRQILTNLMGNAIKFTHKGQVRITASLIGEDSTHGELSIDVSDTGIGISTDEMTTLFDAFTQADSSTTRKYGGTGLGLSIVKRLCELMGGSIVATSTPGQGSTFSINLPVELGSNQLLTRTTKKEPYQTIVEEISWPPNTRILLVEDNATNQIVANGMLEILGLHADVAANGLEALEAIRISQDTLPYSIVLMDCQMPEMDGYDATRAIRSGKAGKENRSLPIVAMTANAMQGDREKCTDAGMDDYIAKPINLSILKSALIKWVLKEDVPNQSNNEQSVIQPITLTDLPIWDESDALKRLGNNTVLLNRALEPFLYDGPKLLDLLRTALDENNSEHAQLHAHSLKGAAGNVSAQKLQNITKRLEEAAKNKNLTEVKNGLQECETILDETLLLFNTHLAKEVKPVVSSQQLDSVQMVTQLQKLKKELENGMLIDTDALGIFEPYLDEAFTKQMSVLKEHVHRFENDQAKELIEQIIKGLH